MTGKKDRPFWVMALIIYGIALFVAQLGLIAWVLYTGEDQVRAPAEMDAPS